MPMQANAVALTSQEEPVLSELRSGYGVLPGSEFPTALYVSVAGAFAWMFGFSWLADIVALLDAKTSPAVRSSAEKKRNVVLSFITTPLC